MSKTAKTHIYLAYVWSFRCLPTQEPMFMLFEGDLLPSYLFFSCFFFGDVLFISCGTGLGVDDNHVAEGYLD